MSISRPPRSPDAGANPTRQMLDELDALMERMLSLPVDELDMSSPAPPPSLMTLDEPREAAVDGPSSDAPSDAPRSAVLPTPAQPVAQVAELRSETQADWQPPPLESSPHLQGPHLRPVPSGKIIVGRLSAPPLYSPPLPEEAKKNAQAIESADEQPVDILAAAPVLPEVALPPLIVKPSVKPSVKPPARRRSLWHAGRQLLLRLNQAFDQATTWLGGTGHWLRSVRGRRVLGLAGLALFALAIVWCLHDWLGWNWFKVSLE
jgi:hypothetical protein